MRKFLDHWIVVLILFLVAFVSSTLLLPAIVSTTPVANAQDLVIPIPVDPPLGGPITQPMRSAISVDLHSVDALVDGAIASVHVTQVFRNSSAAMVEGTYVFPLPADAAVSDFQMTIDGQVMEGKLYSQAEARRIYEEIVRSLRDPALLEYLGGNLFQTSVFPIPAGATRKVELTYTQILPQEDGLNRFFYPLRGAQSAARNVNTLALRIELRNQPGLRTVYSPNFNLNIERKGDDGAIIGYEASGQQLSSDFELFFGTDTSNIGVNLLSYKPTGEDGYFVLLAAPAIDLPQQAIITRDIVLVLDISGSMQGEKIVQAKKAVRYVVDRLNPGDRFNLINFSTGVQLWQAGLQEVNQTTLASANDWIEQIAATGSTDINRALLEALAQFAAGDKSRPAYLLFLTDGLPTQGEIDTNRIIDNVRANLPQKRSIRLFSFGVGYDVNTDLLDTIANDLGGRSSYVEPGEVIDEAVGQFYASIGKPVLADVKLDFGANVQVEEIYPYPLPDLFVGEQAVIVGRYRTGGTVDLTVEGAVNGELVTISYPGRKLAESGGDMFVARLWATRKIGALLSQVRRNGTNQEVVDAIVDLSLKYGIVTPYTAYLVQEPLDGLLQPAAAPGEGVGPVTLRSVSDTIIEFNSQAKVETASRIQLYSDASASGEVAVAASEANQVLLSADVVEAAAPQQALRFVGGQTMMNQAQVAASGVVSNLWVDTRYRPEMSVETIQFGSDRYFELAQQAEIAHAFAMSPEVIVVTGENNAVQVTLGEVEAATHAAIPAPVSPLAPNTPQPEATSATVVPTSTPLLLIPTPTPTPTTAAQPGWFDWLWEVWK